MTHTQKPDLVFQWNGRVHLNRRGCQFSRLMAVEECGSADSDCIDRVPTYRARLLATHSIFIFPVHFPSRASPCATRFRTRYNGSNAGYTMFRGRVQDYWLPTPLACFLFTSPPVRYRVPSGFNWAFFSYKHLSYVGSMVWVRLDLVSCWVREWRHTADNVIKHFW